MQININGSVAEIADGCSVQDMMLKRELAGNSVIIELNGQIVRPEQRPDTKLKPNDKLEIIRILGGG